MLSIGDAKTVDPVFIIGCSRTGSTLQQRLLNKYTDIDIAPELHILSPRWLRKDFVTNVRQHIGTVTDVRDIDRLIELMYSGTLSGAFWQDMDERALDADYLRHLLINSDRTTRSIVDALLTANARANNKHIKGAKFPVHLLFVDQLLEWYPTCRIIHTIRDPRAIFSSQVYKRCRTEWPATRIAWAGLLQFVHVSLQTRFAAQVHDKLKGRRNYLPCKYEDLVVNPERTLKVLCAFLNTAFTPQMVEPSVFAGSSYVARRGVSKSFFTTSVHAWKHKLPRAITRLLAMSNSRAMRTFGYN